MKPRTRKDIENDIRNCDSERIAAWEKYYEIEQRYLSGGEKHLGDLKATLYSRYQEVSERVSVKIVPFKKELEEYDRDPDAYQRKQERIAKEKQREQERQEQERIEKELQEQERIRQDLERREKRIPELKIIRESIAKYQGCISAEFKHTVGLKTDGTVATVGSNGRYILRKMVIYTGQCNTSNWRSVAAISAGSDHTVGLKADGTVVAVGEYSDNYESQGIKCNTTNWHDIVAIFTGSKCTIGLKKDGTIVMDGSVYMVDKDNITNLRNIVTISIGEDHVFGLKADGTVIKVGSDYDENNKHDTSDWCDIVAISTSDGSTVGLKSDGTVLLTGANGKNRNTEDWRDIVSISTSGNITVGLKADGTVVATHGYIDENRFASINNWHNIVAISAGYDHIVGLKSDGTVVAVGDNDHGKCNVSDWRNIGRPSLEKLKQSMQWVEQKLCYYCGGKMGGFFIKKCKGCGEKR